MYQKALSNSDIAGKIVMLLLSLLAKGNLRIFPALCNFFIQISNFMYN